MYRLVTSPISGWAWHWQGCGAAGARLGAASCGKVGLGKAWVSQRVVAQFGSALGSGPRGREFKSPLPDHDRTWFGMSRRVMAVAVAGLGAAGLGLAGRGRLRPGLARHGFQRDMAQFGSALHWGCRGRGFKSRCPDHLTGCGTFSY